MRFDLRRFFGYALLALGISIHVRGAAAGNVAWVLSSLGAIVVGAALLALREKGETP